MKKYVLVLLVVGAVGLVEFSLRPKATNQNVTADPQRPGNDSGPHAPMARTTSSQATEHRSTVPVSTNRTPWIRPPAESPNAVRNAAGLVTKETADLGDGRGPVDRRFSYDSKGQLVREIRLHPETRSLLETVEYDRNSDGEILTRIIDSKGLITVIRPDGKIVRPDGTIAN